MSRRTKVLVAVATVAVAAAACSSNSSSSTTTTSGSGGSSSSGSGKTLTIGILTDATGEGASGNATSVEGVKAGTVLAKRDGYTIKYVVGDTETNPGQVLTAAQTLVEQDHVSAIVSVSALTFEAAPWLTQHGVPVVGIAEDGPEWITAKNMFSVVGPLDTTKVATTPGLIFKMEGGTNLGTLGYGISPTSAESAKSAAVSAEAAGLKAPYVNANFQFGSTNVAPIAVAMKQAGVNAISPSTDPNTAFALITALRQQGVDLKIALLATGYGGDLLSSGAAAEQTAQGVYFLSTFEPIEMQTPATKQLQADMKAVGINHDPTYAEYAGYTSMALLLQGLQGAGSSPDSAALIKSLGKITDFNAAGLFGTHKLNLTERNNDAIGVDNCYWVTKWSGSAFQLVKNADPLCGSIIRGMSVSANSLWAASAGAGTTRAQAGAVRAPTGWGPDQGTKDRPPMNTAMLLEMAADGMPDRVAVGTRQDGLTYRALLDRAHRVAAVIAGAGPERVGFLGVNSDLLPLLVYGTAVAGVPFAPLNYRLAGDRLRSVVARTAPSLVVADDREGERIQGIDGVEVVDRRAFEDRLAAAEPGEPGFTDPDGTAIWLFTSGTTGEPKVAVLRHRHLASYILTTLEFMSAGPEEAALVSVPPYHVAGIAAVLSSTYVGRRIVYLPQFDPKEWVETARREEVTHAMVVPTMLGRILDVLEATGTDLPHLAHLSYGGGRMPTPVVERAMEFLPSVGFVNAYGLTETSSTIAVLGPDDHREAFASDDPAVRARLGSVGRPLPTLELEIRDPEGAVLPAGESGEIHVRGEQIAGEYQGRSALGADGWFPTNDAGYLDQDGFLFVEGRLDDVIVRGGENISPGEIEAVLLEHPAVADVAVVGVPDDEWGECPAAAVVAEAGAEPVPVELHGWVRDRLRSTRAPVAVVVVEELPHNETGKLLRRVLREDLARAPRLEV